MADKERLWRLGLVALIIYFFAIVVFVSKKEQSPKKMPAQSSPTQKEISASTPINIALDDIDFPDYFFFGTASSDFQTTGGTGKSDFDKHLGNIKPRGTDMFNRYKEDFSLAAEIGIQSHRLSLEWARLEPEPGKWDMDAVKKYTAYFSYMK